MASENGSNKNEVDVFDDVIDIPVILFQDSADSTRPRTRPTVEVISSNNNGDVMIEKSPSQVPTQASGTLAISIYVQAYTSCLPSHPVPRIRNRV